LALGLSFDPNIHDALSMVPVTDPSKDNIVITVVKPGYFVNDDLLRPASVIVGKIPTQGE
jgi:molecular chaperone GrpE